ncbi:MAG: cytochrome-c peroxidase [Phycisphaerae bacterium]
MAPTIHLRPWRASVVIAWHAAALAVAVASGAPRDTVTFTPQERRRILQHAPLPPPPPVPSNAFADNAAAAQLGRSLFFDKGLSGTGRHACSTCHEPAKGFADGRSLAEGVRRLTRHAPTIWNAAYNRWFFWDGRADSLWAQALRPIEHPSEMAGSRLQIAHRIADDAALRRAYEAVFGPLPDLSDPARFPPTGRPIPDEPDDPMHRRWVSMTDADRDAVMRIAVNVCKAIAAYERLILSRHAPFDRFAEGLRTGDADKMRALSLAAQRGLKLFVGKANCRLCHSGPNFSDGEFHSTGVPTLDDGPPQDPGRFAGVETVLSDPLNARGPYSDEHDGAGARKLAFLANGPQNIGGFKTPTLRNIAVTAPYMHQGQFATLRDVVRFYSTMDGAIPPGHHRELILKPLNLTPGEQADLIAFLEALTDTAIDPSLLEPPDAPYP